MTDVAKQIMRENMLALRFQIAPPAREHAAKAIMESFIAKVELRHDSVVAGYWPIKGEADVRPLLHELIRRGHRAALPQVAEYRRPLVFRAWHEGVAMVEGRYGIHEPDPAVADSIVPDVVLVPMLGFDVSGNRLGYGSGFYDRTFAALRGGHKIRAIGIAFEAQKLDALPEDPYDVPMDMIITETTVYKGRGA